MTTLTSAPLANLLQRLFAEAEQTEAAFRAARARLPPA